MSDAEIMAEAYNGGGPEKVEGPPSSMSPSSKPPTPIGPRRLSGIMDLSTTGPETHPTENGVHGSPYPSLMGMSGSNLNNGGSAAGSKLACRYCGKTFSQAGYIKAHERLHTGEKPFACSVCGKRFSDPSNWKKHERVHANQARKTTGPLPQPDMTHKVKSLFLRSVASSLGSSFLRLCPLAGGGGSGGGGGLGREAGEGASSVVCKVCFKVFSSQSSLSTHKRIHTGERPYRCMRCGKAFTQVGTLRTHERVHTGEKPYRCRVCGRTFAQSGSFRMHERRHATDATQRCHVCYATFASWKELQCHMESHPQVSRSLMDSMDEVPSLMSHLENGDGPHRPPLLPEHMLMDSDGHFSAHRHHHPPGPVFHHASQLPPFSSIVPFRTPPFPGPLNIFTSQPLSLSQPTDFTSAPLFQPAPALALPAPLKVMEMPPSPGVGDSEVVSTTSQLKKYGSESHMATAVSTPEGQQEPMVQGEGADTNNCHPPSSESSDTGSQSPEEGVEVNGDDMAPTTKRAIERQNLNTRMMGAGGSSRKQRHPMRRFSSASSEQETPQSTSSLATSSLSSTTRESRDMEDQGLVAYLINKGRVYKCEHCRIIFDDCTLYLLHNGFHSHDAQPFRCGICRAVCHDRIEFNCHLTSHIKLYAVHCPNAD